MPNGIENSCIGGNVLQIDHVGTKWDVVEERLQLYGCKATMRNKISKHSMSETHYKRTESQHVHRRTY